MLPAGRPVPGRAGRGPGWSCREPDSPTRPSTSPGAASKSTPSTALTAPRRRPRSAPRAPPCRRSALARSRPRPASPLGGRRPSASSGFVGNGDLLRVERCLSVPVGPTRPSLSRQPSRRSAPRAAGDRLGGHAPRTPAWRPGSAGGSGSPAAGRTRSGGAPGMECSPVVDSEMVERSSSRCTGAAASANTSRASLFDDPAGVHHRDPVAGLGDDPEVVGDQQQRGVEVLAQVGRIRMICASTSTSSAVVGSSATMNAGPQHQRERDHDAAAACRRRTRADSVVPGRRDAHAAQRLQRAGCDLSLLRAPFVGLAAPPRSARDPHERVEPGHRLLEDHAELAPAQASAPWAAASSMSRPLEEQLAVEGGAPGSRPSSPRPRVDLPQPDSPTRPRISPGRTSKVTPSTARTGPRRCRTRPAGRATDRTGSSLGGLASGISASGAVTVRRRGVIRAARRDRPHAAAPQRGLRTSLRPSPTRVTPMISNDDGQAREQAGPPDAALTSSRARLRS